MPKLQTKECKMFVVKVSELFQNTCLKLYVKYFCRKDASGNLLNTIKINTQNSFENLPLLATTYLIQNFCFSSLLPKETFNTYKPRDSWLISIVERYCSLFLFSDNDNATRPSILMILISTGPR